MKKILVSLLSILMLTQSAYAGTCETSLMPAFTAAQATQICKITGSAINHSLIPSADDTYDLGSASLEWKDLYVDGTANIDALSVSGNGTIGGTLGVTGALTGSSTITSSHASAASVGATDGTVSAAVGVASSSAWVGTSSASNLGIRTGGTTKWTLSNSTEFLIANGAGGITAGGAITSSASGSLGWSYVTGANTACTTTCTFAAVFGVDLAAGASSPVIVGPSDATADACVCAGAN